MNSTETQVHRILLQYSGILPVFVAIEVPVWT